MKEAGRPTKPGATRGRLVSEGCCVFCAGVGVGEGVEVAESVAYDVSETTGEAEEEPLMLVELVSVKTTLGDTTDVGESEAKEAEGIALVDAVSVTRSE